MNFHLKHLGIRVDSLSIMVEFYKKLGFKIIYAEKENWSKIAPMLDDLYIIKLINKSGFVIELIKPDNNIPQVNYSKYHMCFNVDNFFKTYIEWPQKDIYIDLTKSPNSNVLLFFGKDPEGNILEIVEK